MRRSAIVAVVVLGLSTLPAREARALGPIDVEAAAKIGGGTSPFGSFPNPLGFGLGARGGVVLGGLYGGVSLIYYFGGGSSAAGCGGGNCSASSFLYGLEGGYGGKLFNLVTLRGQLGIGNFQMSEGGSIGSRSASNLYLEPGLVALVSFGMIIAGVDANILILPGVNDPTFNGSGSSWDAAYTMHIQGGIKF
jgi:hypothetical protein